MKIKIFFLLQWIFLLVILGSCSTTRHLDGDEVLYVGTRKAEFRKLPQGQADWEIRDFAEKSKEVVTRLWIAPNGSLFGLPLFRFFPVRLYLYNAFYTEKDSGFSHWMMENFGEPPLTIDKVNPELRVKSVENVLFNYGHFGVEGNYEIKYRKNGKKGIVRYYFHIPEAYTYRKIEAILDSGQEILREDIDNYLNKSVLMPGKDFNLDQLDKEKTNLWIHLQNRGYLYLGENDVLLFADTTAGKNQVDLQFRINDKLPSSAYAKVKIEKREIFVDSVSSEGENEYFRSGEGVKIDRYLINHIFEVDKDSLYTLEANQKTVRNALSMGMFTTPEVDYFPTDNDSAKANAVLNLRTSNLFVLGIDTELNQKSTGFLGPAVGINASQRNLFGSAENLDISLNGYLDFPYGVYSERTSRSSGISLNTSLSTPALRTPFRFIADNSMSIPRRAISLGVDFNNRRDYFRITEWKSSYDLRWMTSPRISHKLNLVNLNYSYLINTTAAFDTLLDQSATIRNSFRDQLITGPSYTFTWNNTADPYRILRSYYDAEIQLSGNVFRGLALLTGDSDRKYEIFGVPFSQFVRFHSDFRFYLRTGKGHSYFAFRNIFGIGLPYGNSTTMPYPEQFYIGGSSSLRPATARVLGPGRTLDLNPESIYQVGDIKIEANLEYRFKIAYIVNGAVWSDWGNIWLLKEDPERPGAEIRWNKIFRDSYFSSGIGLRVDLDFVLVRADFGAIMYLPFLGDEYGWIWQNKLQLYGLVFGIGYPF